MTGPGVPPNSFKITIVVFLEPLVDGISSLCLRILFPNTFKEWGKSAWQCLNYFAMQSGSKGPHVARVMTGTCLQLCHLLGVDGKIVPETASKKKNKGI